MNAADIRAQIAYDPSTGEFKWLVNKQGAAARIGASAGCRRDDNYVQLVIDGRRYFAHRLAWQLTHGDIPAGAEIDHIDHDPSNNRIENLRLVTTSGNRKNRSADSRNKSGVNGVYWATHANAWAAQIRSERRTRHLGYFKDLADAAAARKAAEQSMGFHPNHGRKEK